MDLPFWYATSSAIPRARSLQAAAREARDTARWLVAQKRVQVQQDGDHGDRHARTEPAPASGAGTFREAGTPPRAPTPPPEAGARASLRWWCGNSPTPPPPVCGFRIASAPAEPTGVVLGVSGEIGPATSVPLADTLASHLLAAEPGTCVVVDPGTVTSVDVRGLRVLLEAIATARSRAVVLAIVECPACSSRLMKLTDTADLIDVC